VRPVENAPRPPDAGTTALVERSEELALLAHLADQTAAKALAPRSRSAYAADWTAFERWCSRYGLAPLPAEPDTIRLYLTDLSLQVARHGGFRYSPASLERFLASISRRHRDAGYPGIARHPRVREVMAGIRRDRGTRQRRARPLLLEDVIRVNAAMDRTRWPTGVAATRDSFALLLTFATALRRSEVAGLDHQDLRLEPDGLELTLGRSKTDQEGKGVRLGVPYGSRPETCVPCAFVRWVLVGAAESRAHRMKVVLTSSRGHVCRAGATMPPGASPLLRQVTKAGHIHPGRLSASGLNEMLKRRLAAAGYDPRSYGYHSLRAGFVTQARRNGADARSVRLQTRHSSDLMVDAYDREYQLLSEYNAVWKLGL
jgi:integrase